MNRLFAFLFCACALSLVAFTAHLSADQYWITFVGEGAVAEEIFLLQIDGNGNVLHGPESLFTASQLSICDTATAIAQGKPGFLNLWLACEDVIVRSEIDKTTLVAKALKDTGLTTTDDDALQATEDGSLLAVATGNAVFRGFVMLANGAREGTSFRLSPRTDGGHEEGSISADGRVALSNDFDPNVERLYLQPLSSTHRPKGDPVVVATGSDISSTDISNPLVNGRRFVISFDEATGLITLQAVTSAFAKVGGIKTVGTPGENDEEQIMAIDPSGHFIVYARTDDSCAHTRLLYQALDANGNAVGAAKNIIACGDLDDQNMEGLDMVAEH